jgi:hypothetical protein
LLWVELAEVDMQLLPVLRDQAAADRARASLEDAFKFPLSGDLTSKAVLVDERWVGEDVIGKKLFRAAVKARTKKQQSSVKAQVDKKLEKVEEVEEPEKKEKKKKKKAPSKKKAPGKKAGSKKVEKEAATAARELTALYEPGYEPPKWSIEQAGQIVRDHGAEAMVYYTAFPTDRRSDAEVLEEAMLLTQCREPVNIAMDRSGAIKDRARIKAFFGCDAYYGAAAAQALSEDRDLPVNIAIYAPAMVRLQDEEHKEGAELGRIHFLHAIGCALDSTKQPDYIWFKQLPKEDQRDKMIMFYDTVLAKIFQCAKDKKLKTILLFAVGMANFAKLYPGGGTALTKQVFLPLVEKYVERNKKINVIYGAELTKLGFFPNPKFAQFTEDGATPALFCNAYDGFSVIGNGNGNDHSLDGYVGAHSSSAVMGTPQVNSYLRRPDAYVRV